MSDPQPARGRARTWMGATTDEAAALGAAYADHLRHSLAKDEGTATNRDRFLSLAMAVRDRLIDQWMANKAHRNLGLFIEREFKREYHGHHVDQLFDLIDPLLAPRPYLRTDVVEHLNAELFGGLCQA